jgi:hypothetical protein
MNPSLPMCTDAFGISASAALVPMLIGWKPTNG